MLNNFDNDKDYYLNPRIKRTDLEETYSEEQLLEYVKCSEDPKYFIENYVEINTLDHGFVKFKLRGYQEDLIDCFNDNSKSIILSSRQSGKCIVFNTLQTIKNKKTGRIETITIGDFFNRIKLNENNNPILFNNLIHSPQSSSTKNKLSDNVERKFIESYDIEDYEVLTDTGFWPINYLHKTIEYETWEIVTDSRNLQCADTHIVFDPEYNEIFVKDLIPNKSLVITDRGPEIVRSVKNLGFLENMFDLTIDSEDHRFYTDGILSHNSITTASYILWYVFFHPDSTVYILANKAATAREILARVKAAYERTPFFLQPGASVWNKGSIELGNTSKIVAAATTSDSIRGQTANCVTGDTHVCLYDDKTDSIYYTEITKILNNSELVEIKETTMHLHYLVYKTTNKINGKIYIGYHQTKNLNDGYLGSGKLIKRAVEKYGATSFEREILGIFSTKEEAEELEAKLVDKDFTLREDNYNIWLE